MLSRTGRALSTWHGLSSLAITILGNTRFVVTKSTTSKPSTIFALSTPEGGRSAIAVFRVSGPTADSVLAALLPKDSRLPPPRTAHFTRLIHPDSSREASVPLDDAICIRFPGPNSATGEDVVELQVHGGRATVKAISEALAGIPGVRPAEPGEFTRRAFDSGRLDLTQVEGLADLLAADTEAQRVQAVINAGGAVRKRCDSWRGSLIRCLSRIEAVIDFGEDEGIAETVVSDVLPAVVSLREDLESHLSASSAGEIIRQGVRVAILGAPNAGKSSLLNALVGRDVAIVSSIPGTTRDLIEASLDLKGIKVIITDTAGLRETQDVIEAQGVERALKVAKSAHVIVSMREPGGRWTHSTLPDDTPTITKNIGKPILKVENKSDLGILNAATDESHSIDADVVKISCLTGRGISEFLDHLSRCVKDLVGHSGHSEGNNLLTRSRHRHHVETCIEALRRYQQVHDSVELAAEELRVVAASLGRVTGAVDTEDVLDSLFAEFCIGK
jgi:tRNA modification GTPase